MSKQLQQAAAWASDWFGKQALPVWFEKGADKKHGGWHEKLNQDGSPTGDLRRFRVQARQLYVYAEAQEHELYTNNKAVEHGLKAVLPLFREGEGFPKTLSPEMKVVDASFDLYDNVFGLLGLGGAYRLSGDAKVLKMAQSMVPIIEKQNQQQLAAAAQGGALICDPMMHYFETCMYWGDITGDDYWLDRAGTGAKHAMKLFFDRKNSILHETFNAPDQDFISPGHHFEWAWLLDQWEELSGDDFSDISEKLYTYAEAKGIDRDRKVAVDALALDGSVNKATARQWPQTERLRAALSRWRKFERPKDLASGLEAFESMKKYLATPTPGLWFDSMNADGSFDTAAPAWASSAYHYLGAVVELRMSAALADDE